MQVVGGHELIAHAAALALEREAMIAAVQVAVDADLDARLLEQRNELGCADSDVVGRIVEHRDQPVEAPARCLDREFETLHFAGVDFRVVLAGARDSLVHCGALAGARCSLARATVWAGVL